VAGYIIFLISESFNYFSLAVSAEYVTNNQTFFKFGSRRQSNVPDVKYMENEDVKKERTDFLKDPLENSSVNTVRYAEDSPNWL